MKRCLFVNSPDIACGVAMFGQNLYAILKESPRVQWQQWDAPVSPTFATLSNYDLILYNWSSLIGGWISRAPFLKLPGKQFLVFHDGDVDESRWDGIFFSDLTMAPRDKWHILGRPLPQYTTALTSYNSKLTIGCHGFLGAWADEVVKRVMQEFEAARIRLLLPYSAYCDPNGDQARAMADRCRDMVKGSSTTLNISHNFLAQPQLLDWLAANDMNVYIRPLNSWRGVSSAPDAAIAVRKPVAVNCCSAFRHLHKLKPSIVVDESSLMEILGNGLAPMIQFRKDWCDPEKIRQSVEAVIE